MSCTYNLHEWISNSLTNPEEDLSSFFGGYTFEPALPCEFNGTGSWKITETSFGLDYSNGTLLDGGDGTFGLNDPAYFASAGTGLYSDYKFKSDNGYNGYMVLSVTMDQMVCWTATYKRTGFGDRLWSLNGPGRFPSTILLPYDADRNSVLLTEDGIIIPPSSYSIELED